MLVLVLQNLISESVLKKKEIECWIRLYVNWGTTRKLSCGCSFCKHQSCEAMSARGTKSTRIYLYTFRSVQSVWFEVRVTLP